MAGAHVDITPPALPDGGALIILLFHVKQE
jgi:hypothetical protein